MIGRVWEGDLKQILGVGAVVAAALIAAPAYAATTTFAQFEQIDNADTVSFTSGSLASTAGATVAFNYLDAMPPALDGPITALMTFGIVLAAQGAVVPVVDVIVLTTALCFSFLNLARVPPAFAIIATTAGAVALFHGVADGARALPPPSLIAYVCGFLVGNVVLYGTGLVAGEWFRRHSTHWIATLREAIGRWRGRLLGA